ncbi:hypothetical protein FRC11_013520, partial [Ceratobasidium sp. 423]
LSLDLTRDVHTYPKSNIDTTRVGLPKAKLEALWGPIRILQLKQFYPMWTSKAYHGLLELHLTGGGPEASIPESRLVAILKSSPGLRLFKIDFEITRTTLGHSSIEPVPLIDLEQLSVKYHREPHCTRLWRLIAPGTKPLSLTILKHGFSKTRGHKAQFTPNFRAVTETFLSSSNVTRLYACCFDNYGQIADVLSMVPSVRVLVLDGCECNQIPKESALPPDHTLDELYVIRSTNVQAITWPSIERIVEKHHVHKLTLWWYDHRYNGLGGDEKVVIPDNLYTVCPVVNIYTEADPNPIEEWE